ncbi:hypothetical protein TNCV_313021 [Trichonephila clavipes]|nr:hypothetical protein TNCV_313021 [Trichonephila clavipes]
MDFLTSNMNVCSRTVRGRLLEIQLRGCKCSHKAITDQFSTQKNLLDSLNQELTIDALMEIHEQEQDIKELESLQPVQSEDPMTVGNLTEGLRFTEKGLQILENTDSSKELRWGLGGRGHVEGTGEKLSFASQAAR